MTRPPEAQEVWARLLVDALVESGVEDVVLSPGSRSTPLVLALVADGRPRIVDVIDERTAGFVALGMARVTGKPAALVCTSGSAPSHYFPALIEAEASRIPLVVVSANRPFALQRAGESQTIDQTKLFSDHVRFFADLGEPSSLPGDLRSMRRVVAQAVFASRHPIAGPVHLDARFVKPLEPVAHGASLELASLEAALREVPPPRFHAALAAPSPDAIAELVGRIRQSERPMVVAGPALPTESCLAALVDLHRCAGLPIYVEASSGARFGAGADRFSGALDAVFRADAARESLAPDFVLQVGRTPIASSFGRLAAERGIEIASIDESSFLDPWCRATLVVHGSRELVLSALGRELMNGELALDLHWARTLSRLDASAFDFAAKLAADDPRSEGAVVRAVVESLPHDARLVLGNSLAIREVDAWVAPSERPLEVVSQRGASGIDGLVAGLVGAQLAAPRPSALLLGDVSFAHDLGALPLLTRVEAPTVVIVVDNGGGRIFEQLPVATRAPSAMSHFVTPPGLDIVAVASAMGLRAVSVHDATELRTRITDAMAFAGASVLVVEVPESGASTQNRALWNAVDRAVREEVER